MHSGAQLGLACQQLVLCVRTCSSPRSASCVLGLAGRNVMRCVKIMCMLHILLVVVLPTSLAYAKVGDLVGIGELSHQDEPTEDTNPTSSCYPLTIHPVVVLGIL